MTKPQLTNLEQTDANTILISNISNTNNLNKFELASSHARVTSIKFTKQQLVSELVSESVSQLVTSIPNDRTRVRQKLILTINSENIYQWTRTTLNKQ